MVRSPKRRPANETAYGQLNPSGRVNPGDQQRLLGTQIGQESNEATGKHGFARSRRTHHQHVMAPGRGHFQRPTGQRLAPDIS